ncbi:MAG TPA: metallophosphoesterase [Fimbriiglobus sp.]|jgi:3',5'-cyclic AMP phosphodiesterase CpdA
MSSVKLAHFSDVHLTADPLGWRLRDVLSKKASGWMNVRLLGRGRRFKYANAVVAALRKDLATRGYDHLVFSGDATTLAFESEMQFAADALGVDDPALPPGLAVPGNHDYYTRFAERTGLFEAYFAPWQEGERVDSDTYPFAKRVGNVWLIGVNSCTANRMTWDATGRIGDAQLDRLRRLCATLSPGPRLLVTHFPLRNSHGKLEVRTHRLRDHAAALAAAKECKISLWLHGHLHRPFFLHAGGDLPFPVVCGGSAAQTRRWSYHEYDITVRQVRATRRVFEVEAGVFKDDVRFQLDLGSAAE